MRSREGTPYGVRGKREAAPPLPVHVLTIPDELLAWAQEPAVARSWARPWGHEAAKLVRASHRAPLPSKATESLLGLLGSICVDAVRAGRQDLLLGFDLLTADWLGLVFTFQTPEGPVSFGGRHGDFSYAELHALTEAQPSPEALAAARACKGLLADVFPRAEIGAIIDAESAGADRCSGCGTDSAAVMFTMETGSEYCKPCWVDLTTAGPSLAELKAKSRAASKRRKGKKGAT